MDDDHPGAAPPSDALPEGRRPRNLAPELSATIRCPDCAEAAASVRGYGPVSRAFVNELHWGHRPMHPNEVGANHRRQARTEYDEWERLSPFTPTGDSNQ